MNSKNSHSVFPTKAEDRSAKTLELVFANPSVPKSEVGFSSDIYFFKNKKGSLARKERKFCLNEVSLFSFSAKRSFCLKKYRLEFFGSFLFQHKNEHQLHSEQGTETLSGNIPESDF